MNNKLKAALIVIIGIFAILLTYVNYHEYSEANATEDAAVSGFGEDATTDLYLKTVESMTNKNCSDFINETSFLLENSPIQAYETLKISSMPTDFNTTISCIYVLDNLAADFRVFTYPEEEVIDDTLEDKLNRLRAQNFDEVLVDARIDFFDYMFGVKDGQCVSVLNHALNDYDYSTITYDGIIENCMDLQSKDQFFNTLIAAHLADVMNSVYIENRGMDTIQLLFAEGLAETYLPNFEY